MKKEIKISFLAAHATTIVSVTLVLMLIGIIAMITSAASGETRKLREQIELSAIMGDSISDAQAATIMHQIQTFPEVKTSRLITKDEAMKAWKEQTDEDLEEVFGVNIFSPEVAFTLNADATHPDSIAKMKKRIAAIAGIQEVAAPDTEMVTSMNENISRLSLILGVVAIVMLVISFVLINNTVHLSIYSRRFTIHTMELVGATNGFIRGPFVRNNLLAGVIAGVLASGVMALSLWAAQRSGTFDLTQYISWRTYGFIAAGMVVCGALICSLAAWIATARYLRKDYGALFK